MIASYTSRVNKVTYQAGTAEQFIHQYSYDADDRLIKAQVSKDGTTYQDIAKYEYYLHGPLKNQTLGNSIQQLDYIYNLQGWLKAINGNTVSGIGSNAAGVSPDVFGEVLHYYTGDYKRGNTGLDISTNNKTRITSTSFKGLYNGTIASTTTYTGYSQTGADQSTPSNRDLMGRHYTYDVLHRLKNTQTQLASSQGFTGWRFSPLTSYNETLAYDANGNITSLDRTDAQGNIKDKLTCYYNKNGNNQLVNNKLNYVDDAITDLVQTGNFKDQSTGNYDYDLQGRLTKNTAKQITAITYTAFGKVSKITRLAGSNKPNLEFKYDAFGHRIYKKVDFTTPNPAMSTSLNFEEWYVLDASGTEITSYKKTGTETNATQQQMYIFAASKVGYYKTDNRPLTTDNLLFEISDHLGSVRAIVKGTKTVAGNADIVSLRDYYSFGATMRKFVSGDAPVFGFHGMKLEANSGDDDEDYTTEFRQYDADLGRWLTPDPLMAKYPSESPYSFCFNNPVYYVDPLGLEGGVADILVKAAKKFKELLEKFENKERVTREVVITAKRLPAWKVQYYRTIAYLKNVADKIKHSGIVSKGKELLEKGMKILNETTERDIVLYNSSMREDLNRKYTNLEEDASRVGKSIKARIVLNYDEIFPGSVFNNETKITSSLINIGLQKVGDIGKSLGILKEGVKNSFDAIQKSEELLSEPEKVSNQIHSPPTNKVTKFTSVKRKVAYIQHFKNEEGGYDSDTTFEDEPHIDPSFIKDTINEGRPTY